VTALTVQCFLLDCLLVALLCVALWCASWAWAELAIFFGLLYSAVLSYRIHRARRLP
jgi:hypothetical protein